MNEKVSTVNKATRKKGVMENTQIHVANQVTIMIGRTALISGRIRKGTSPIRKNKR